MSDTIIPEYEDKLRAAHTIGDPAQIRAIQAAYDKAREEADKLVPVEPQPEPERMRRADPVAHTADVTPVIRTPEVLTTTRLVTPEEQIADADRAGKDFVPDDNPDRATASTSQDSGDENSGDDATDAATPTAQEQAAAADTEQKASRPRATRTAATKGDSGA